MRGRGVDCICNIRRPCVLFAYDGELFGNEAVGAVLFSKFMRCRRAPFNVVSCLRACEVVYSVLRRVKCKAQT